MTERVIVILDVTMDEAQAIAERTAGVGPWYEAFNLPIVLDELSQRRTPDGMVKHAYIRSDQSAALGGKDWEPLENND